MRVPFESPWAKPARGIWFALAAPLLAWGGQLTTCWLIAEQVCLKGVPSHEGWTAQGVRWLQGGISLAALAVALTGLAVAFRSWRRSGRDPVQRIHGSERPAFMSSFALLLSAFFTIGIIWAGFAIVLLPVCEAMR